MYGTRDGERHPSGVTVLGSAVLRTEPDHATLQFKVSRVAHHVEDAVSAVRAGAEAVRRYLGSEAAVDVRASRLLVEQPELDAEGGMTRSAGYRAEIEFHASIGDLDRLDELLAGVVAAGANELVEMRFRSREMKAMQTEAQRQAIGAARDKASGFARAAGAAIGRAVHIEDLTPRFKSRGGDLGVPPELDDPLAKVDPGAIVVSAAVRVTFSIADPSQVDEELTTGLDSPRFAQGI